MACRHGDTSVDARQRLALQCKVLLHRVRLAQHAIGRLVAAVYLASFLQEVVCLRVGGTERRDVITNAAKKVGAVARFL